ncbi:PREDICTED: protein argonaute-2-like [Ceratosolen solmsi marchali]|uniref:Protein argonaute-2-like n=1 Tax=Ceratosolen solmsi marchali TaxID=326594 RepID=A0AAJ7DW68_9HYME|nr:PREDICTED: protein argonaute-2-like [Ceratosolen solmsi marchali]
MMQIKFGSKFQHLAIHYDVDIVPNLPKYLLRPAFKAAKSILFPNRNPAFDGKKNAFSAGRLPIADPESITVKVHNEDGREKEFRITFKIANEIDLSWLRHVKPGIEKDDNHQLGLQVLDVILRDAPSNNTITIARSFFSPPKGQVLSLGGGLDLWTGLFQSAVLGWKPYLNVDVSYKGFPKSQNVIDLLKTICSEEGGGRGRQGPNINDPNELLNLIHYNMDNIKKFLKNIKVTVEIPGQATSRRTQRINDLVKCPRDNMFVCNGSKISVEQYYKSEKKYVIKYPFLPCLWVGPRDKNIHVPPEICTIVSGQTVQKPLNPNQTASMVRYAATSTTIRKKKILEAFQSVDYERNPCMNEFDISINGEFEKVPARVLDPPQLSYQNGICRVAKGIWRPNKFLKPSSLISSDGSWTILNLTRFPDDRQLYELNNALVQTGKNVGMQIGKPVTPFRNIQLRGSDIRELSAYFNEQKKKGLKLIIVIVSETKGLYGKVKQITELNVGVLTQCLKSKTLMKLSDATLTNILLKINAKLNGINHTFETKMSRPKCLNTPCMIVGADVTHPSPDAINIPSIAAITASHDPNAFMYNVEIRLQPPRQEIISSLTEVIIIQLKYFLQKTGHQPQKIIYYRDGVSEGQFHEIMNEELMAIRRACEKLNQSYKPHITFLVVQKRHHIRLFPLQPQFSDDAHKNFNVQAGTIVDTAITHPSHIDFYLVSHASIQGTARPTKYRCLWDDSDMSEDEIENLTYFLCHMFSRCTRSVSYPTPTYYAHLAAFRARALTEDVPISLQHLQQEQLKKLTINSEILKGMPMFFV